MSSIDVNFFFLFWHVLIFIYTFLRSFFSFLKHLFTWMLIAHHHVLCVVSIQPYTFYWYWFARAAVRRFRRPVGSQTTEISSFAALEAGRSGHGVGRAESS